MALEEYHRAVAEHDEVGVAGGHVGYLSAWAHRALLYELVAGLPREFVDTACP